MASATTDPSESSFDDPAFGQDDEAFGFYWPQYRLENPAERFFDPGWQAVAAVGRIGEHDSQPSELPEFHQHEAGSVVILPVGSMHDDGQDHSQRIDGQMSLPAS